ncbi:hypothetical protein BDV59DRAFT_180710 [Aspergillus ambiguus]|uniref:uncharacterized protein n=1 Tax=Aspergillus ambiguus TaxID=176160 RepID=UPI003CCCD2CD
MTAPTLANVAPHSAPRIPTSSPSYGSQSPVHPGNDRTQLTHEELKTSVEQAKLDRRRYEHAMLRDALRRGTPYLYIPGLLARSSPLEEARPPQHHDPAVMSPAASPGRYAAGSVRPGGVVSASHFLSSPVGGSFGSVVPGRRLDLDDSFLRRAYKRRRSWGAGGRGKHRRGQSSGEISFQHWVPVPGVPGKN